MAISEDAHENVHGLPYASETEYSHSSTLRTMHEIFDVDPPAGYPWLGAAAAAHDLNALFKPGAIK
jgi:DNA primase